MFSFTIFNHFFPIHNQVSALSCHNKHWWCFRCHGVTCTLMSTLWKSLVALPPIKWYILKFNLCITHRPYYKFILSRRSQQRMFVFACVYVVKWCFFIHKRDTKKFGTILDKWGFSCTFTLYVSAWTYFYTLNILSKMCISIIWWLNTIIKKK